MNVWNTCVSKKDNRVLCMNGECVKYEQLNSSEWRIELFVEDLTYDEISVDKFKDTISEATGIDKSVLDVLVETNERDEIDVVVILVNDEDTAHSIANILEMCSSSSNSLI